MCENVVTYFLYKKTETINVSASFSVLEPVMGFGPMAY